MVWVDMKSGVEKHRWMSFLRLSSLNRTDRDVILSTGIFFALQPRISPANCCCQGLVSTTVFCHIFMEGYKHVRVVQPALAPKPRPQTVIA
jgi:hypothetical protein